MGRALKWIIILALLGAAGYYGLKRYQAGATSTAPTYTTSQVRRDDLVATISATGTIEPEDLIDVGAQVAGKILEFGVDTEGKQVDYGSHVTAKSVLALIDDSTYRSAVLQAQASVASAKASLDRAKADMEQYKANHGKARRDWERAQRLGPSDALARSSYDSYQSAFEVAAANLQVGQASIKVAQATIVQAEADLDRAQQNLGYCTILSPVDGVIIDRRVNIGQTVVASLSAPSLFLIAKDLRRVQIWVSVNEADIGQIHVGQPVAFTVDAFPELKFKGQVGKVRLNAGMTQNVVTYTVEVTTDNSDGKLLPYLTANVKFETARADDALLVPNAALRWAPAEASAKASASTTGAGTRPARSGSSAAADTTGTRPASRGVDDASTATQAGRRGEGWGEGRPRRRHTDDATSGTTQTIQRGTVWVLENEAVRPIPVVVGITDGIDTAVRSPELKEGMAIVTNAISADTKTASASPARSSSASPFIPQMPRRDRRAGGPGGPPGP